MHRWHVYCHEKPTDHEEQFFNRKLYHSRNVQIGRHQIQLLKIANFDQNHRMRDLNILNADATFGAATHDAFIWRQCVINAHMQQLHLYLHQSCLR